MNIVYMKFHHFELSTYRLVIWEISKCMETPKFSVKDLYNRYLKDNAAKLVRQIAGEYPMA